MNKNYKIIIAYTIFVIFISFTCSFSQTQGKENNFIPLLDTKTPSDSIFQHYSLDELLEFQKYYKNATDSLLKEQEKLRQSGIQNLELFLKGHPNSPILDKIIIRLANLLYEQALQDFEDANDEYNRLMTLYNKQQIQGIPEEPVKDFRRPLSLYQQIIDEFPHSKLIDDAIYNKGCLLEESGKNATAYQAFKQLVDTFPESPFVPDALMRMAEYYFNPPVNNLEKAIELYKIVLNYQESPKYDAALYRLGWAYYRLSDYPQAISYFTILADDIDRFKQLDPDANYHFPAVREEAIEYIGISFLDYGGPNQAAQYFKEIGGRSYGFDVLKKIGDAYMDVKEEYGNAINAYQLLLSMYPDSPEAPAIQAKIAEAYRNSEDENMAYARRAELFQKYKSDGEWWDKIENPSAKKEAMALAEKAIRDNINLMLKKAEKTKDSTLYLQAIEDSRDYLTTFSADSNAALIHWNMALTLDTKLGMHEQAFDEYIKISNLYWNSKFQKQAAENAIAIADETIKADGLEQKRAELAVTNDAIRDGLTAKDSLGNKLKLQKIELTPDELQLVAALENYIKLFPDEPETAKILAKTGSLYYDHHQFKESIKYFKTLVKHYPDSPEANYARYITMESYFGKSDYESTEILARRLKDSSPEYASKANKRLSESIFLQAEAYADSSDHLSAAAEYRRIVTEVPTSEFADLALYNASLEYERAKEYEKAVDSYKQLLNNYPQSEHTVSALNNLAFDYRELNDYHNAASTYEQLAALQPNQSEAQVALYNASVSFVQAEEWQQAIRLNTKFVERFPDAEDADVLLFNNANYYFKLNDIVNANKIYEDFANKFPDTPRAVEAHYHRGMYFKEHNRLQEAKSEFDKAITKNTHLKEINKETNELFAAEALFQLTEIKFDEFKNIKFKLPAEILAQNKAKKKALLLEIVDNYTKVAAYGTLRLYESTYKIGYAYEDFADTWAKQDMPELDENQRIIAQNEVFNTAAELYERAVDAYKNGVNVLEKFADSYTKSVTSDTVDFPSKKLASEDSTMFVAERWINKCKEKISENLYDIAEIRFESANQIINAPPPAGIKKIEELVYRNQLLVKVVSPILKQIIDAHTRNINEGQELHLENQWIELSKNKIVTTSQLMPDELRKLGYEALLDYSAQVEAYKKFIENGDEAAFDLADQLSNFLDLGKLLTLTAAQKYKENVNNFRILNIQPEEIDATENRFLKSIYEYATLADSLSSFADGQRQYYENLFKETEKVDYEDAYLIFDEHHFALSDGAQELLKLGYETSQELQIINEWSRKISLALLRKNPEEFAEKLGFAVQTKSIASSSDWLVSSEFQDGWQGFSFIDSQWQHAYNEGPATNIIESGAESIWLVNIDKSQITALDSATAINQVATASDVAPNKLSQILNRPNEVYFRKSFNIEGLPVSGILQLFLDDSYTVFLNGQLVEEFVYDSTSTLSTRTHTISDYLQSGKNIIAIKVHDSDNSHGSLEAVLEIKNIPEWFQNQEGTEKERN